MRFFPILVFLLFSLSSLAQQTASNRAELEKRRESLLQSIKETQDQLEATKKDKKASLSQLRALQSKLAERQKLISNINQEIGAINKDIQYSAKEISDLQRKLGTLKVRYAQSVRYAYKHRSSYSMIAFLFSSSDFNQAIRRLKYLKKYRDYRKEQAEQIRVTHKQIEHKINVLNTVKSQKDFLRLAQEQQKIEVQKEANETDRVVRELKGREKELSVSIERNRKAARQVDLAIQKIIQREIELARIKAEEERKRKAEEEARLMSNRGANGISMNSPNAPATSSNPSKESPNTSPPERKTTTAANRAPAYINNLTPEAAALSASFENNRGKLPWPVEKGIISLGFGTYQHPTEKNVTLENYGIDITTNAGMPARSVFSGVVSSSFYAAGIGYVVIVNHGEFFSVYRGLSNVSVKKDQAVTTKQVLGTVGLNDDGVPVLNFQIWKVGKNNQSAKVDPGIWIAK